MVSDFRKFVARGNVFDLAVGVIIGAAFATVVKSFVDDILMPPIGKLTGGVDFSALYINLSDTAYRSYDEAVKAGAPMIRYGAFINNLIIFLITAFAVYLLVKAYERAQRQDPVTPPEPNEKDCPFCRSRVNVAAVRCPFCTSELAPSIALR
jgi:large conductance mechanosensitive channel